MELKNFINNNWVEPDSVLTAELCDANTGEFMSAQPASSAHQVDAVLSAAQRAFDDGYWSRLARPVRAQKLDEVADLLAREVPELAHIDSQQTGVVLASTARIAMICAAAFRGAAALLRDPPQAEPLQGPHGDLLLERLPLGVAAVVAPWNAPSGIACHKLASALAAGCPTVLKPSEWAPGSAQLIARAVVAADLPAGVFQLLHGAGETGASLVMDKRVAAVSFTGGLAAGRGVAHACAEGIKPVQLELGGNNPLLVLEDANLEAAAEGVVTALTTLNGQWCRALGRLLVHQDVAQQLLTLVAHRLEKVVIGNSLEDTSEMGPLVHSGHLAHVQHAVQGLEAQGADISRFGRLPDLDGWFMQPTLISGLPPERTVEEIFGPVAAVHAFRSDEEGIALANQTPYGLAAYVFGDEKHAWRVARRIRAGNIKINGVSMLNLNPAAPRPAWGLSGLGDEGTRETMEFFRGHRLIGVAGRPGDGPE